MNSKVTSKSKGSPVTAHAAPTFTSSCHQTPERQRNPQSPVLKPGQYPAKSHKNSSSLHNSFSKTFSSPCKSRLDVSSIPYSNVDIKACQAEMLRYKLQHRKDFLHEKKMMRDEWQNAKKKMSAEVQKEFIDHQERMTQEMMESKRLMVENNKERKERERKERAEEFMELQEAKRRLKEQEMWKSKEYMEIERNKSMTKQREIEERKEKDRIEREEKRIQFLEAVDARKRWEDDEREREKREAMYEYAQEVAGSRELAWIKSEAQKSVLDKTMILLN